MSKLRIHIIVGSTREGRFADKAAAWVQGVLGQRQEVEVKLLDLRDFDLPFFNESVSPSYKQAPYENKEVARFTAEIAAADAYVIVTPEYNHGTSAVLKNAMDWVYQEWNQKAVAFVSYGSVGGARAVEQLRLTAIELQMAPIRNSVHMLGNEYFPVAFGQIDKEQLFAKMDDQLQALIEQLLWWAKALKAARKNAS